MDEQSWPWQSRALVDIPNAITSGVRRICLVSPTGMGKTHIICKLVEDDLRHGRRVTVLANRKALIDQLRWVFTGSGIEHGVRASQFEPQLERQVQISSIQTEHSRVIKSDRWAIHNADRVYCDEQHLQKSEMAQEYQRRFLEKPGSVWIGSTATPIDIASMCDVMIEAGTKSEGRAFGALVPGIHKSISEPDMRGYKRQVKTGEYTEGDVTKAIMSPNVFGLVYESWKRYNPDGKPTILFGPSVAGAMFFAEKFLGKGVKCAHIDGQKCWINGEEYETTSRLRQQIFDGLRRGDISLITNRHVLREAVDLPCLEVGIFATVMGSLASWLQSTGRLLRASKSTGKTRALVLDHGGMWHRLGSFNADRLWNMNQSDLEIQEDRNQKLRDGVDPEPIRCPQCGTVRAKGGMCPECGFKSDRRTRLVVQQNGELVEVEGDIFIPRRVRLESDTAKNWKNVFWACRKSGKTFKQALGWFYQKHGYWPPMDLPLMPLHPIDQRLYIQDVPFNRLVPDKPKVNEPGLFTGDLQ